MMLIALQYGDDQRSHMQLRSIPTAPSASAGDTRRQADPLSRHRFVGAQNAQIETGQRLGPHCATAVQTSDLWG